MDNSISVIYVIRVIDFWYWPLQTIHTLGSNQNAFWMSAFHWLSVDTDQLKKKNVLQFHRTLVTQNTVSRPVVVS